VNVANQVWAAVHGSPLTIATYFPRNQEQRDILIDMTQAFLEDEYSLIAVLVTAMTHPLFNNLPPSTCGSDQTYPLPPVFNPYTVEHEDSDTRGNGVGDTIRRLPARSLVWSVTQALSWSPVPDFFGMGEGYKYPPAGVFQRDVGAYLKDTSVGFSGIDFRSTLAWETAYGTCDDPRFAGDDGPVDSPGPDWIDTLLANTNETHTLGDAVRALKDRLLTDPVVDTTQEAPLLESLMGASLDTKIQAMDDAAVPLRRACAAFLASPQFLLEGDAGPDRLPDGLPEPILPASTFKDYCETLGALLYDDGEFSCTETTASVTSAS